MPTEKNELTALTELLQKLEPGDDPAHFARQKAEALALAREIQRKTAETDLYKAVLDHLEEGIYVTDHNGVTIYVNPAYVKNVGVRAEEVLGRTISEILKDGSLFKVAVTPEVLEKKTTVKKIANYRMRGKQHVGILTGIPVFGKNGQIKNVVVSSLGFDQVRLSYEEFKNSNVQIKDAVRIAGDDSTAPRITMVGKTQQYEEIKSIIEKVAETDATVLITGESGVGKEVVADQIQHYSRRRDKPFIKVNCAAIPQHLLESELFGYEKGSFTGADPKGKQGLFELANHGTILLDEIGDMPLELQTRLLRVIQQREVMRIGGAKAIPLDIRIIAATNCDLKQKVKDGTFRQDLYYRLSVVPIFVPSLRERREDVQELTTFFLAKFNQIYSKAVNLSADQQERLKYHAWPGNIRELQNMIEYLVIFSENDGVAEEIFRHVLAEEAKTSAPEAPDGLYEALRQYEEELIKNALATTGGIRKAAAYLKVNPSTISRKARSYGLTEE